MKTRNSLKTPPAEAPQQLVPARWSRAHLLLLAVSLALPLLLLLWSLESAPGIHLDEAWVTHGTYKVAFGGARPTNGMVGYAGSLHLYLLAAVVRIFGLGLLVFRAVSVVCNVLFVVAFMAVARAVTRKAPGWQWAGVLVASSPLFLLESRFTTEMTTFMPVLLMGGLALSLSALAQPRRKALVLAVLGGVLLGLACYTHAVGFIFVIAAAVGAVAAHRARALTHPVSRATAAGFVAGLLPRLFQLSQTFGMAGTLANSGGQGSRISDLPNVLSVMSGALNGNLLYRRFTGQELWTVVPYATLALIALAAIRILAVRWALDRAERAALWAAVAALVLTALCTPQYSLRYFMAAVWTVLLWLFVTALAVRQRGSLRAGRIAVGLLAAVVVLNLVYVLVDFHVAFARTGGRPALFRLGSRLTETSNHFMRTDRLYRQLADRGLKGVMANNFIAWPLAYEELVGHRGLAVAPLPVERLPEQEQLPPDTGFALVYYAALDGQPRPPAFDFVHAEEVEAGGLVFRRDPAFDPNFRVFLSPAAWNRR